MVIAKKKNNTHELGLVSIIKAAYRKSSLAAAGKYRGHLSLGRPGLGMETLGGSVSLSLKNPWKIQTSKSEIWVTLAIRN